VDSLLSYRQAEKSGGQSVAISTGKAERRVGCSIARQTRVEHAGYLIGLTPETAERRVGRCSVAPLHHAVMLIVYLGYAALLGVCRVAPLQTRGNVDCLLGVCSIVPLHLNVRIAFGGPLLVDPARHDGFPVRREPTRCKVPEESGRRRGPFATRFDQTHQYRQHCRKE
jgi:hypothetical protein